MARAAAAGSCVTIAIVLPFSDDEPRQDVEHRVGAGPVEVAGRLVGEDHRRVGRHRARDRDALLLPARELLRPVVHAVLESPTISSAYSACSRRSLLRERRQEQRQLDVLERRQHRDQVERLEDEADVARAPGREVVVATYALISSPPTTIVPASARSSPPSRFRIVDLPEPDGPISARNSPARDVEVETVEDRQVLAAAPVAARHAAHRREHGAVVGSGSVAHRDLLESRTLAPSASDGRRARARRARRPTSPSRPRPRRPVSARERAPRAGARVSPSTTNTTPSAPSRRSDAPRAGTRGRSTAAAAGAGGVGLPRNVTQHAHVGAEDRRAARRARCAPRPSPSAGRPSARPAGSRPGMPVDGAASSMTCARVALGDAAAAATRTARPAPRGTRDRRSSRRCRGSCRPRRSPRRPRRPRRPCGSRGPRTARARRSSRAGSRPRARRVARPRDLGLGRRERGLAARDLALPGRRRADDPARTRVGRGLERGRRGRGRRPCSAVPRRARRRPGPAAARCARGPFAVRSASACGLAHEVVEDGVVALRAGRGRAGSAASDFETSSARRATRRRRRVSARASAAS